MTGIEFGRLHDDEFDAGYVIIVEVTEWLLSKGIQQWLAPLPEAIYRKRQDAGENYALRINGELAAVVSLMDNRPHYWSEYLPETPFTWLGTLAMSRRFAGINLGEVMMNRAIGHIRQGLEPHETTFIYIDCLYGSGFLPDYYSRLGFETIVRKVLKYPGQDYDSVLMRLAVHRG
jgi:hypothetical protein